MDTASFTTYLEDARNRLNAALSNVLDDYLQGVDPWLADPIRYACESGGKRFRPILFLASYQVGGRPADDRAERVATALEIVHAYSLVHDDLPCMDDDDWRRGKATCHRAFGVERATIAAAAMVPLAGRVIASESRELGLEAGEVAHLVAELSRAAGPAGMVGGQTLDLLSENREITQEELGEIHRRKTGALIRAAACLGGRAGRASPEHVTALSDYGAQIGLAFQIADDLLDAAVTRTSGDTGSVSDRALHKATYPRLLGHEAARQTARQLADRAIHALREGGVRSEVLEALALHVVERER